MTKAMLWVLGMGLSLGGFACQSAQQAAQTSAEGDVKKAMEEYIQQDIDLRGAFWLRDARDGSILNLSFDHVHEHVHKTKSGEHYACVDFKDDAGNIYDVDVYMEQKGSTYRPAKLVLHKVNGEVVAQQ